MKINVISARQIARRRLRFSTEPPYASLRLLLAGEMKKDMR